MNGMILTGGFRAEKDRFQERLFSILRFDRGGSIRLYFGKRRRTHNFVWKHSIEHEVPSALIIVEV